jgi:Fe-S oxidoreductase
MPTGVDKCNLCGLCKARDPVFRVVRRETYSDRAKMYYIKKGMVNELFFLSTLSGITNFDCPSGIRIDEEVRKYRQVVLKKFETDALRKLKQDFYEYGYPFNPKRLDLKRFIV